MALRTVGKGFAGLAAATLVAFALPVRGQDPGLAAWERIYLVFSHPRCANCHVEDERPRWSGPHYGAARVHGMNVQRGSDGFGQPGLRCATCHQAHNAPQPHGPPGAPAWHLAPAGMAWWQRPSKAVCEQVKDPARNGGRTLDEVARHVRDDGLVAWDWAPGAGREPAPGSAEQTYDLLRQWSAAGAPCPEA